MDELVKSQQLIDDMAMAIAQGNDEQARKHYEEYKKIYEKITKKKFPKTFEELKKARRREMTELETEIEI